MSLCLFNGIYYYNLKNLPLQKFLTRIKYIIMYPQELVLPMKAELTDEGFEDMTTANAVENTIKKEGTTLVVINSVCGCAAGACRPGVIMAVNNAGKKPTNLATSFAGYDTEAVQKVREYLMPYPPSSPAIALFKDGALVSMFERHQIEGYPAQAIAQKLITEFEKYCNQNFEMKYFKRGLQFCKPLFYFRILQHHLIINIQETKSQTTFNLTPIFAN